MAGAEIAGVGAAGIGVAAGCCCMKMMDEAEVALAPGRAFGENGEGYVRIALVENQHRLRQAMRNLDRALNPRQPKPPKKKQAATA